MRNSQNRRNVDVVQRVKPIVRSKTKLIVPQPKLARPPQSLLTTVADKTTRLQLPHGSFNAGLIDYTDDRYVCVYRPDERSFIGCILDGNFKVDKKSHFPLGLGNCADPRLLGLPDGRLLMIYSSTEESGQKLECIRGGVIMDIRSEESLRFIKPKSFRVSPPSDGREKNWMPFLHEGRVYLIASVNPHIIFEWVGEHQPAESRWKSEALTPWFNNEFMRGNTTPVRLDDGNYLGTFHTVVRSSKMHYYDNGFYVFEGKPPFKMLRCANRTYLPAEAAVEPHFRKKGQIQVCFPVGMVREGERLLISYGDNDSCVKILETTVSQALATTLAVY